MATVALADDPPKRFAIRPDSLAASVALLLCLSVVQRGIGFGRSILLCRWLSPAELGRWDLTLAFFDLAAPIVVLSIPACFARYVEHYRQRGQLRVFLKRTGAAVLVLAGCAVAAMGAGQTWLAHLLYGNEVGLPLVGLVILALPAVVLFNTANELFVGLRMFRAVTLLQFAQSLLFAAMALSLAGAWHAGADGVIAGYGLACVLCALVSMNWLVRMWWHLPQTADAPRHAAFWGRLLPFAGAVWVGNLLGNLFMMTDRYLILHCSAAGPTEAAMAVGQYHSARVAPVLIVQLSGLIGAMFIPHLTCDWEAGRRALVNARLNLVLKLLGLGATATAVVILALAPILFVGVFSGKFPEGQAILCWTLLSATWFGMFCIARSYLWCDERVWLVSVALVLGIAVNVGANLVLLPHWGIRGAAVAASLANLVLLAAVYGIAMRRGLKISLGVWVVSAVPASLCLGPWAAAAVLAAVAAAALGSDRLFDRGEKRELATFLRSAARRWRALGARRPLIADTLEP